VEPRDAVVIGAGQAGLAVSHELSSASVDHVVLERSAIGSSWRRLWDSFRLNTPSWATELPGQRYEGDEPDGFMAKEAIVAFLRSYGEVWRPRCGRAWR
jgi:putative flavoprotein involved in K+ transport